MSGFKCGEPLWRINPQDDETTISPGQFLEAEIIAALDTRESFLLQFDGERELRFDIFQNGYETMDISTPKGHYIIRVDDAPMFPPVKTTSSGYGYPRRTT